MPPLKGDAPVWLPLTNAHGVRVALSLLYFPRGRLVVVAVVVLLL